MWVKIVLASLSLLASSEAHGSGKSREVTSEKSSERSGEDSDEAMFFNRKDFDNRISSTTARSMRGEVVVEKFVETLMASERYLKMIESVEKKLNHLDATFHERTNSILKYVGEMLRAVKMTAPGDSMEGSLRSIKTDLEKLKVAVGERVTDHPTMRGTVEGAEFHADPALDTRLTSMENQIKNIASGVESIVATISEVKTRQYARTFPKTGELSPGPSLDSMNLINEFRKTLHDHKTKRYDCKSYDNVGGRSSGRVDRSERYPTDCHEIQMQGFNVTGIYKIKPDDMEPFYVLCELSTTGGGWTVLQSRFDGSQDFYKGWDDYKNGFGNLAGEFWLGLEKINYLTNQKLYELRVELETQHGAEAYAGYSVFTVGPEYEGFRISTLGTYYGNAGDSLSYHAGQKFSTSDTDNDEWKEGACAIEHGGAWWYKECDKSNLNGKYSTTTEEHRGQSIYWISFKGPNFPLAKTKMMIRPLPASRPNELAEQSRKIVESTKLGKPEKSHGFRTKSIKDGHYDDVGRIHPAYKYDEVAEAFFPTYP